MELPKLTSKQQKFVLNYVINGGNATLAYKLSYDCEDAKDETVWANSSKLLKNTKVAQWIETAQKNVQQTIKDEINYSALDCFNELDEVQSRARNHSGNYSQEIKAIELKGKLAGHFVDKHEVKGGGLIDVLDQLK